MTILETFPLFILKTLAIEEIDSPEECRSLISLILSTGTVLVKVAALSDLLILFSTGISMVLSKELPISIFDRALFPGTSSR